VGNFGFDAEFFGFGAGPVGFPAKEQGFDAVVVDTAELDLGNDGVDWVLDTAAAEGGLAIGLIDGEGGLFFESPNSFCAFRTILRCSVAAAAEAGGGDGDGMTSLSGPGELDSTYFITEEDEEEEEPCRIFLSELKIPAGELEERELEPDDK